MSDPRRSTIVTLIAGSKRRSLLMAGADDMTRSLNITSKTTEQHLTARSDNYSVAYVTNNKRLYARRFVLLKLTSLQLTDTKHHAASLRQQSFLSTLPSLRATLQVSNTGHWELPCETRYQQAQLSQRGRAMLDPCG